MEDVPTGIYPGLTYDEYDRIRGVNWSVLRRFKKSAAHARSEMIEPPEPSEAMEFGQAFHRLVLEPSRFDEEYVLVPDDAPTRRSNAGKAWWEAYEEQTKGKTRLTSKAWEELQRLRAALFANATAAELLSDPKALREVAVVWDDAETGERCKGRLDLVSRSTGRSVVADVKTDADASAWKFSAHLDSYDWAGQLQWYVDGLQTVAPMRGSERVPLFVVVEKEPPYCAVVYELGRTSRDVARQHARRYMSRYIQAQRTGLWPGYQDAVIELPAYVLNRMD
jgi:PDDEXK-like domain of unknown function (DUF3799)